MAAGNPTHKILLVTMLSMLTAPANAGTWARNDGTLFIAVGGNFLISNGAEPPVYYDPTVYASMA
jgi:hypothetical protein